MKTRYFGEDADLVAMTVEHASTKAAIAELSYQKVAGSPARLEAPGRS
jgi:hypothetical protein